MARRAFYSFHYDADVMRTALVRNIGAVAGERQATDNGWEAVKKKDNASIQRWIKKEMEGRTCAVVLVGSETAGRKWINYEIVEAWNGDMGVVGIHIHMLKDPRYVNDPPLYGHSWKGANPFASFPFQNGSFDQIVGCYDPGCNDSQSTYAWIQKHLGNAIEGAIAIRSRYPLP
jgi:hypothetical protein